jgi:hypothetical protein
LKLAATQQLIAETMPLIATTPDRPVKLSALGGKGLSSA